MLVTRYSPPRRRAAARARPGNWIVVGATTGAGYRETAAAPVHGLRRSARRSSPRSQAVAVRPLQQGCSTSATSSGFVRRVPRFMLARRPGYYHDSRLRLPGAPVDPRRRRSALGDSGKWPRRSDGRPSSVSSYEECGEKWPGSAENFWPPPEITAARRTSPGGRDQVLVRRWRSGPGSTAWWLGPTVADSGATGKAALRWAAPRHRPRDDSVPVFHELRRRRLVLAVACTGCTGAVHIVLARHVTADAASWSPHHAKAEGEHAAAGRRLVVYHRRRRLKSGAYRHGGRD